ncbi:protein DOWNY MILDEW RESISTANCE 6-like isoform X2 [Lycium barbarum]|uniref:protein DOWNY MILDEW RESISTANCE 6-like isoform X2 n=1 Tax=Lycium barbarum TaxID=112863 RepID=UPI00293EFA02|nr:protein DOWNY MILDEW RESISTANCE 6-like isoform X2 [Lycium barbarum]
MANLVSTTAKNVYTVPGNYVMPPDKNPSELVSIGRNIPVTNLAKASSSTINHAGIVQEMLNGSQEFGSFQIINHGVSEKLMDDVMDLFKELFEGSNGSCKVYGSGVINHTNKEVRYWKDLLIQPVFPIEEQTQHWLDNPPRYRYRVC